MNCPNCGNDIEANQKFCTKCGTKIEIENNNFNLTIVIVSIFICIIVFTIILLMVFKSEKITQFFESSVDTEIKADNCESYNVKNLAIQIFKDNNSFYKSIDPFSVADIVFMYPSVTSYDKEIDKYFCSGRIVVKSTDIGFQPSDSNSEYADFIHTTQWDESIYNYVDIYKKYTQYICDIEYTSQISEGETLVNSSYCHYLRDIDFNCEGNCADKVVYPEQEDVENNENDYNTSSVEEPIQTIDNPIQTNVLPLKNVKDNSSIESSLKINNKKKEAGVKKNYIKEAEDELL